MNKDSVINRVLKETVDEVTEDLKERNEADQLAIENIKNGNVYSSNPSTLIRQRKRSLDSRKGVIVDGEVVEKIMDFMFMEMNNAVCNQEDITIPYFGTLKVYPKLRKKQKELEDKGEVVSLAKLYILDKSLQHPERQWDLNKWFIKKKDAIGFYESFEERKKSTGKKSINKRLF